VKDVARLGGQVHGLVPPLVEKELRLKLQVGEAPRSRRTKARNK